MKVGVVQTMGSVCRCGYAIRDGLESLGHEVVLVDSCAMEQEAVSLAENCDLVFDHTDTFSGRGICRALVRMMLEHRGAKIVGSPGRSCLIADDKAAAKLVMAKAGIPVPPGLIFTPQTQGLPVWLRPPLIVKSSSEHMSRGVGIALSEEELHERLKVFWEHHPGRSVLVEPLIQGLEITVPILEGGMGPYVLPVLKIERGRKGGILDEAFKKVEHHSERLDMVLARLPRDVLREIELLACTAFEALGLRDYARFDVRLSQDGTPFFLEANVTPCMEPFEAMAVSARIAGMSYPELLSKIMDSANRRYKETGKQALKELWVYLSEKRVRLLVPEGVEAPRESSIELARLMDVRESDVVLDLGCGSGILSLAAALKGARKVVAVDISPKALDATLINAVENGLNDVLDLRAGSWFDTLLQDEKGYFDFIVSAPPQTPAPQPIGPKYGGRDGLWHFKRIVEGAPMFLKRESGRLWLLAISLVDLRSLLGLLEARFHKVEVVRKTRRPFVKEEYNAVAPGLMDYLVSLRDQGLSQFHGDGSEGSYFENIFIRASGPRT